MHSRRNSNVPEELEIHVERMLGEKLPKSHLNINQWGKRSRGRPKKRRKDQFVEEN
jgi:hypothetical protein